MSRTASAGAQSGWVTFGQFWVTFASMPHCCLVLARNLIPEAVLYVLEWSYELGVLSMWFDGVAGLAAIDTVFVVLSAIVGIKNHAAGWLKVIASSIFFWVIGFIACALPYLMVLGMKGNNVAFSLPDIAVQIQRSPSLWIILTAIALSRFKAAFASLWLERSPSQETDLVPAGTGGGQQFGINGSSSILLAGFNLWARGFALLLIAHVGFGRVVILLLALALTYLEVLGPVLWAMPKPQPARQPD